MYGLMLVGLSSALALWEILRLIRSDRQDQDFFAYAYQSSKNHSFGSRASNINKSSSVQNSSCNDRKDPIYQSDPSRMHESYPNLSTSTSTGSSTKNFQQQSEYGNNKSKARTKPTPSHDHQSKQFLSQSSSSSSSTSYQPRLSSVKAKSPKTESPSLSSFKKPSSSELAFSPLPSNSRNQPTKANSKRVYRKDTSPGSMIPKDTEKLIKKDSVADVLKKPLSLHTERDNCVAPLKEENFYEYHTKAKTSTTPILELNFLGLPIRPGVKNCLYYMYNGSCKYEAYCKYNHPNPTAEGDSESPSGYANGGSVLSKDASQARVRSWSSPMTLNETSPFVPMTTLPNPLQNSEWNGYQHQDIDAIANYASERNRHRESSFESQASGSYSTSSLYNSSCNDSKEPPSQSDQSRIYCHEHYPNVSNSASTNTTGTKKSQPQSDYWNNESPARTQQPSSPDQYKPALSQSSSVTIDKLQSYSTEAKPSIIKSQSRSFSSSSTYQPTRGKNKLVVKDTSPICMVAKDTEYLIKKGVVPDVLKKPLSQSTYKDYFAALLYAEDFYIEKWKNFQLLDVTLESHEASVDDKSTENKNLKKIVALKIDSTPERRPFILSRDFVIARRLGNGAKIFQGIVYRVVKSNLVLIKFEEEFYSRHDRNHKYDVSFSFNRVWLKRAHQAISVAVSGPLLEKYLFPEYIIRKNICYSNSATGVYSSCKLDSDSNSAIHQILSSKGNQPFLVEGPLCASTCEKHKLSKTGVVVREAVLQIYRMSSSTCRILVCSPQYNTSDILLRSLKSEISESLIFRVNVAFGEVDEIPGDILHSCVYEGKRSSFPSLKQLEQFRVIFSTFVGSFCLVQEGITAGHFSHIFLVDASSVTEPETMIPLSNLANENTTVVLTGTPNNQTTWVRSDIAKKNGLRISYFERLSAINW